MFQKSSFPLCVLLKHLQIQLVTFSEMCSKIILWHQVFSVVPLSSRELLAGMRYLRGCFKQLHLLLATAARQTTEIVKISRIARAYLYMVIAIVSGIFYSKRALGSLGSIMVSVFVALTSSLLANRRVVPSGLQD